MRDLIACLHIWLTPGLRRALRTAYRRARNWLASPPQPTPRPVLPTCPAYARGPLPAHVHARRKSLGGEENRFVRPYIAETERITADVRAAHCMFDGTPSNAAVTEMSIRLRTHLLAMLPGAQVTLRSLPEGGPHTPRGRLTAAIDYAHWQLNARVTESVNAECHMYRLALAVNGLAHDCAFARNGTPPSLAQFPSGTTRRMPAEHLAHLAEPALTH